jgi:hypothetical protein
VVVPHLMLSWQYALAAAGVLAIAATVITVGRLAGHSAGWALWGGVARESALLFGLYALWQFAGSFKSVYSWHGGFDADEFSAMPSVHVGWALIVAIAVITVSRSRWRWLTAAYPVLTLLVVVVTANHFWLDGIVAGLLVALVLVVQRTARRLRSGKSCEGPQVKPVHGKMSMRS